MKFHGLRPVADMDGVTIAVRDAAEVDFDFLNLEDAMSLAPTPFPTYLREPADINEDRRTEMPICYRENGEVVEVEGCLIYDAMSDLVHFFEHYYVPGAIEIIDDRVRPLQNGRPGARGALERRLRDLEQEDKRLLRLMRSGLGRRAGRGKLAIYRRKDELSSVVLPGGETCRWFFAHNRTFNQCMIVRETSQRVRGRQIPRLAFLLANQGAWRARRITIEWQFMLFDGETHHWHRRMHDASKRELDLLEAEGTVCPNVYIDPYPQNHLQARALIRVPRPDEAAELLNTRRPRKPRHKVLRHPGILRDSREPVQLPRNLPVIDHVEAALYILARNINGIYLPGDAPAQVCPDDLPVQESWMVLCTPAVPL